MYLDLGSKEDVLLALSKLSLMYLDLGSKEDVLLALSMLREMYWDLVTLLILLLTGLWSDGSRPSQTQSSVRYWECPRTLTSIWRSNVSGPVEPTPPSHPPRTLSVLSQATTQTEVWWLSPQPLLVDGSTPQRWGIGSSMHVLRVSEDEERGVRGDDGGRRRKEKMIAQPIKSNILVGLNSLLLVVPNHRNTSVIS